MLYLLHGGDTTKGKEKLRTLVRTLQQKRPDAAVLRFDEEAFEPRSLDELIHGQGLFSEKSVVVLDRVFSGDDAKEAILGRLADIAASQNVFVLFEGALDKKTYAKLGQHAQKVQSFEEQAHKEDRFNIFALADALVQRDSRGLWVTYQKAKMHNVPDEEVHGLLFWQLKALALARDASSAREAGLNPFVYRKARRASVNFSADELKALSWRLVRAYHEARRGRAELGSALEQFMLSV